MRICVKILSIVLIATMIMGISFVYAEDTTTTTTEATPTTEVATDTTTPTPNPDTQYQEAISTIKAVSIMQGYSASDFGTGNPVTRAELAAIIGRLLNVQAGIYDNVEIKFTDIPADHWGIKEIKAVIALGLMKGDNATTFRPDDKVTAQEAIKVVVCALGYESEANINGGYPYGYIVSATRHNLLKNVDINAETFTRGRVAQVIFNSLNVDIMIKTGIGNNTTYTSTPGDTVLTVYNNMRKKTGIVDANEYSEVSNANSNTTKGIVTIGGTNYYVGKTKATDYLGYKVDFYYTNDDAVGVQTIKYIVLNKNTVTLEIDAKDLLRYSGADYSYTVNDKEVKAKIIGADTLFNKVAYTGDPFVYMPTTGKVTLVDNGNDGNYDLVSISSYKTYHVERVGLFSMTIEDKYAQTKLELASIEDNVKIYVDGEILDISSIQQGDVLTVYTNLFKALKDSSNNQIKVNDRDASVIDSANMKYCEIYVKQESIKGVVKSITSKKDIVTIEDKEYSVSPDYLAAIAVGSLNVTNFAAGYDGEFFLDSNGMIAGVTKNSTSSVSEEYGYLMNMASKGNMDSVTEAKVLMQSGEMKVFSFADKVKFNEGTAIESKLLLDKTEFSLTYTPVGSPPVTVFKQQIIKYSVADDKITKLNTAQDKAITAEIGSFIGTLVNDDLALTQDIFSLDAKYITGGTYVGGGQLSTKYRLTKSTVTFTVPATYTDGQYIPNVGATDNEYRVVPSTYFVQDNTYTNLLVYDVSRDMKVAAIVLYAGGGESVSIYTPHAVVDSVAQVLEENGDIVTKVTVLEAGILVELIARDSDVIMAKEPTVSLYYWNYTYVGTTTGPLPYTADTIKDSTERNVNINADGSLKPDSPGWVKNVGKKVSDLKQGDVIQYTVNGSGLMTNFRIILSDADTRIAGIDGRNGGAAARDNTYEVSHSTFGRVYDVNGDAIFVNLTQGSRTANSSTLDSLATLRTSNRQFFVDSQPTVYIYDVAKGKITTGTAKDVEINDYVYTYSRYGLLKMLMIVKR